MKTRHLLLIFIFSSLSIYCSKSDNEEIPLTAMMQAKVNDYLRVCDQNVNLQPFPNTFNDPHNAITGTTKEDPGIWFTLHFPIADGVGTYQFVNDQNENYAQLGYVYDLFNEEAVNNKWYQSTSGSVTVTIATDSRYKGTFAFEGTGIYGNSGTFSVTEEEFNIEY